MRVGGGGHVRSDEPSATAREVSAIRARHRGANVVVRLARRALRGIGEGESVVAVDLHGRADVPGGRHERVQKIGRLRSDALRKFALLSRNASDHVGQSHAYAAFTSRIGVACTWADLTIVNVPPQLLPEGTPSTAPVKRCVFLLILGNKSCRSTCMHL